MDLQLITLVVSFSIALTNFALAGVVLTSKHQERSPLWIALLAICAGFWGVGVSLFLSLQYSEAIARIVVHSYYVIAALIVYFLVQLALCFPYRRKIKPFVQPMLLLGLIVAIVVSVAPWGLLEGVTLDRQAGNTATLNLLGYGIYVAYFVVYVVIATSLFMYSYGQTKRHNQAHLRHQLRTVCVGVVVAIFFGALFNLLLPLLGNYQLIWAGPPFTVLFVISVFYAIIQQGLFDLRAALARSMAYVLLLGALAVIYSVTIFGITQLFFVGRVIDNVYAAVYVVVALLLTLTYIPVKRFFDQLTHRLFYQNDYSSSKTLQQVGDVMSEEIELGRLVRKTLNIVHDALEPEYTSVYVADNNGQLRYFGHGPGKISHKQRSMQLDVVANLLDQLPQVVNGHRVSSMGDNDMQQYIEDVDAAMIVQLLVQHERIGAIFIGDRKSGRRYDEKDTRFLGMMSDELALAIQNSLRYEEIKLFNDTLKHEVSVATTRLRATNRELQKLDQAKDEFVSMASHQLRTPLTSIKGYVSMVMEGDAGKINDTQRHLLGEAFESSERMVRLIADFLSVSRLQTGKFIIDAHPVDLDVMMRSEVNTLRALAEAHGQTLVYSGPVARRETEIDRSKVGQVVMNFIDNAIYYSPSGSTSKSSLEYTDDEAIVLVKDQGIGVPLEEQERLFSKFFRATNARKQRPDGTGVGLFLAKKVITAHKGAMIFKAEDETGSSFGFRVPSFPTPSQSPDERPRR